VTAIPTPAQTADRGVAPRVSPTAIALSAFAVVGAVTWLFAGPPDASWLIAVVALALGTLAITAVVQPLFRSTAHTQGRRSD
jgi:O-antigen/teichoic acid export membrane protein